MSRVTAEARPDLEPSEPSVTNAKPGGAGSRPFVIASLAVLAVALGLYAPILYYMVIHWSQVEDYSHGFLIVPLALYFAWERRDAIRQAAIEPSWWGLLPLALGSPDAGDRSPRHRAHEHACVLRAHADRARAAPASAGRSSASWPSRCCSSS